MKVHADRSVCIGAGMCVLNLPEMFDQREDDGTVVLLRTEPDAGEMTKMRETISNCPSGALRLDH